jgi:hypothetical protein
VKLLIPFVLHNTSCSLQGQVNVHCDLPIFKSRFEQKSRKFLQLSRPANEAYMRVTPALCRNPTVDSTQKSWSKVVSTESSSGLEVEILGFPDRFYGPPILPFGGYRRSFLGLRRPWCDIDHSPPSCYGDKINGVILQPPLYTSMEWTATTLPREFYVK